jgi:hypothetical protein
MRLLRSSLTRSVAVLLSLVTLLVLTACSPDPDVSKLEYDGGEIYFVTQSDGFLGESDGANSDDADLIGELQLVGGCLQIVSETTENARPMHIVWPHGFGISANDEAVSIRDRDGQVVTQVGERTLLGGGGAPKTEKHGDCEGAFWYAGLSVYSGNDIPAVFD